MAATRVEERAAFADAMALFGATGIVAIGLFVILGSHHPAMVFHGLLFLLAGAAAAVFILSVSFGKSDWHAPADEYVDGPIKVATIAAVFWGIAGFVVGDVLAWQLAFPALNLDLPWTSFGRLRPLHTSAVIFAFGGNVLLATSFYVVQRTCRARLAGRWAPWFVIWGYQLFIAIAGTGYLLGITQGKEYAEPEWYADLWLTIIWVVYLLVFLGTLAKRKEPHIYVANWFYLAFIVTIAMLHLVNNATIPVSLTSTKSYIVFAGVQDAMTQWWYGHNAVGFFLTAGFLGIMYYFIPKRVERPVYSYRLSIVHFWTLIFLYIWAGPAPPALHRAPRLGADTRHDLLDHAVDALLGRHDQRPHDLVGRLGQAAHRPGRAPAGGVGRLLRHVDVRGAGDEHQGGQLALALHRLDHRPRAFRRARLGGDGVVRRHLLPGAMAVEPARALLIAPGRMALLGRRPSASCSTSRPCGCRASRKGLMWRAYDRLGFLQYSFIETVEAMKPYYVIRAIGGLLFVIGALIMAYNIWRTVRGDEPVDVAEQPRIAAAPGLRPVAAE